MADDAWAELCAGESATKQAAVTKLLRRQEKANAEEERRKNEKKAKKKPAKAPPPPAPPPAPAAQPEPALSPEDEKMFVHLMGDPACESFVGDLRRGVRSGDLSKADFLRAAARRIAEVRRQMAAPPPPLPARLAVDTPARVAVVAKRPLGEGAIASAATVAALGGLLSGPASTDECRALWPIRGLPRDPVASVTVVDNALCLGFETDADAEIWCWKMNYEVFGNEAAGMLHTKNMGYNLFRVPATLSHLLQHVVNGVVVGEGGDLRLAPGEADKVGRYEPGRGSWEPLSRWLERTVDRLRGVESYATANADAP